VPSKGKIAGGRRIGEKTAAPTSEFGATEKSIICGEGDVLILRNYMKIGPTGGGISGHRKVPQNFFEKNRRSTLRRKG